MTWEPDLTQSALSELWQSSIWDSISSTVVIQIMQFPCLHPCSLQLTSINSLSLSHSCFCSHLKTELEPGELSQCSKYNDSTKNTVQVLLPGLTVITHHSTSWVLSLSEQANKNCHTELNWTRHIVFLKTSCKNSPRPELSYSSWESWSGFHSVSLCIIISLLPCFDFSAGFNGVSVAQLSAPPRASVMLCLTAPGDEARWCLLWN